MLTLPSSLSRKAIRQDFPKVSEGSWDSFFTHEKVNGLYALRVQGPSKYPYYDLDLLMQWLVQRGLYRRSDFYEYGEILFQPHQMPQIRRHVLAG